MAALVRLINLWPPAMRQHQPLTPPSDSRAAVRLARLMKRRADGGGGGGFRPSAVLHFPGPPHCLQPWPAAAAADAAAAAADSGSPAGVAAILRDANNQRVWATAAPTVDGQTARPVLQPGLDDAYTVSSFCLAARPVAASADGGGAGVEWLAVLSDFYRDRLLVCDLGGRCLQRVLGVPRPGALAADATAADCVVFALAGNGTEVRAFEWRGRRLRQRDGGAAFRHPRLRYGRALAVGAGRVCVADSAAGCVLVVERRRLLLEDGGSDPDAGVVSFACETPPTAVAVAEFGDGDGCVFVNALVRVGADDGISSGGGPQRRCGVAAHDLASGRPLALSLPCNFACACGCPGCVDAGNDPDVAALHFDQQRLRLLVGRRARASHVLVFSFD